MLSGAMSLMTIMLQSSRKCCRYMFVSSLGRPENWFAYTIVMRLVQTAGPTGMLAMVGIE